MRSAAVLVTLGSAAVHSVSVPGQTTKTTISCQIEDPNNCHASPVCKWENNACVMDQSIRLTDVIDHLANKANVNRIQEQKDDGIQQKAAGVQEDAKYGGAIKRMSTFNYNGIQNPFSGIQQNQFGWMSGLGGSYLATQALLLRNPTCPVNVPLCEREMCQPDQPHLNGDAFACNQNKGCCFDMNLYLYQQMFPGVYKDVPTCHRAVKSNLYDWYANMIVPGDFWMPEFSQSVATKLKIFDQQNPDQWGFIEQCPYNDFNVLQLVSPILQKISAGSQSGDMSNYYMMASMSGGSTLDNLARASMMGSNPLLAMLSMDNSAQTTTFVRQIIENLSEDHGWATIDRFSCQMWGGCWLATKNRCVKPFNLNDWPDNVQFTQAVTQILAYNKNDASYNLKPTARGAFFQNALYNGNPAQALLYGKMMGGNMANLADMSAKHMVDNWWMQQKMQTIQQFAGVENPETCAAQPANDRTSCHSHTGNIINDMNMCQLKGCCYDAQAWGAMQSLKNVPLFGAGGKLPTQAKPQSGAGATPFSSSADGLNGIFRRGRGRRSTGQRSSTFYTNPLLNTVSEFCEWNNPLDGALGLASLADSIIPCCQRVYCYSAGGEGAWSSWGAWSACSASCGSGTRTRSRVCQGGECRKGEKAQTNWCNQGGCANVNRPVPQPSQGAQQPQPAANNMFQNPLAGQIFG